LPVVPGLTAMKSSHRLILMRRALASFLVIALNVTSGFVSSLHIHAYSDHDHPEHHHGPAPHDHHTSPAHHDAEGPTLESCDPGEHAVSITMGCAPLPRAHVIHAEYGWPGIVEPLILVRSFHPITDVRVHGPPPRTQSSPRAPPLITHA
jgi:hypothetical protein